MEQEQELSSQKEPVSKLLGHESLPMAARYRQYQPEASPKVIVRMSLEQAECKSAKGPGPYGYAWGFVFGVVVVRFTPWFLYAEPWIQWGGSWTRKIWEPMQSRREDGSEFKD